MREGGEREREREAQERGKGCTPSWSLKAVMPTEKNGDFSPKGCLEGKRVTEAKWCLRRRGRLQPCRGTSIT